MPSTHCLWIHLSMYVTVHYNINFDALYYRDTPIECLHTILLGPYKYFMELLMGHLTPTEKKRLKALVETFNFSGIKGKLRPSSLTYYKSFVGRDFKIIMGTVLHLCGLAIFNTIREKMLAGSIRGTNSNNVIFFTPFN